MLFRDIANDKRLATVSMNTWVADKSRSFAMNVVDPFIPCAFCALGFSSSCR